MSAKLLIASALLSQAVLPAAFASAQTAAETQTITATARVHRNGWLTSVAGEGQYRVSVDVADLDLTTAAGQSKMSSRVRKATAALCEMSAEQPQMRGYYDAGTRQCWRQAEGQAETQMTSAREAARQGKSVATLGFATPQ